VAPFHFGGIAGVLVTLAIGFCFGFVLERAGFGNAKNLAVHSNVNAYVLAGGINRWLAIYSRHMPNIPGPEVASSGHDSLRHSFDAALGDPCDTSRPKQDLAAQRPFTSKVKVLTPVRAEGGGCG
jgi:hypothetical protein